MVDDLYSLDKQIRESEAYAIEVRLDTLTRNFLICHDNFRDLKKLFEELKRPEVILPLLSVDNRDQLYFVLREITRRLVNYLASAKAIAEQTSIMVRDWYSGTDFLEDYDEEIKRLFTNNPLVGFVEGLRNYSLHYRLPFANAHSTGSRTSTTEEFVVEHAFILRKADIENWSRWNTKGKAYLDTVDDSINIETLIEEYHKLIHDFHIWMHQKLREIHKQELDWLDEMWKKHHAAYERIFGGESKS